MYDKGRVSVIIPTKNSEKTLKKCLLSVAEQTYKNIEVLIVDGNSTDNTKQVASSLGAKVITLDSERARAKNYGVSVCSGEFVLFIDSDMVLQPSVIQECVNEIVRADGVIIPERSIGSSMWVKIRDFERSLYAGSKIESARFFVKSIVEEVGGFDEDVVLYEESTLPQKLERKGYVVNGRITSCILHDESSFSLRKWLNKKRYYSETVELYSNRYKEYAQSQLSISYRLSVFVSKGKWKKHLRNPSLSLGLLLLKLLEYSYSKRAAK